MQKHIHGKLHIEIDFINRQCCCWMNNFMVYHLHCNRCSAAVVYTNTFYTNFFSFFFFSSSKTILLNIIGLREDKFTVSKLLFFHDWHFVKLQNRSSLWILNLFKICSVIFGMIGCKIIEQILKVSIVICNTTFNSFKVLTFFLNSHGFNVSKNKFAICNVAIVASTTL